MLGSNGKPFDPSPNVIAQFEASSLRQDNLREASDRRQDDLRQATKELFDARVGHVLAMAELRAQHAAETRAADNRHASESREAEKQRINAIREVDVNAVTVASQRAAEQASVLAAQVSASAEALRSLVGTTANTVAQAQQQLESTLSGRISILEQFQYKGEGRSAVSDPRFESLLAKVESLGTAGATGTGRDSGVDQTWKLLAGILGAIAIAAGLYATVSPSNEPATPQVVYVPSAPGMPPVTAAPSGVQP
jgi:hypothetical protein